MAGMYSLQWSLASPFMELYALLLRWAAHTRMHPPTPRPPAPHAHRGFGAGA